jgi:hypothetical protein
MEVADRLKRKLLAGSARFRPVREHAFDAGAASAGPGGRRQRA